MPTVCLAVSSLRHVTISPVKVSVLIFQMKKQRHDGVE